MEMVLEMLERLRSMYREVDMYVRFGKTRDIYSVERTKTKNQDLGSGTIYRKTRSGGIFGNKEHLGFV